MSSSPASMMRPAFTLLEMILAATIAVLLLGALYVAVNLQLQHAESAREVVTQASLARNIFNRMATDIAPNLTTVDQNRYQPSAQAGSGSSGGSGMSGGSGGTGMTGGTGSGASGTGMSGATGTGASGTSGTSGTNSSTSTPTTTAGNNGLAVIVMQGTTNTLTLFTSRMPPVQNVANAANQQMLSDQHRIVYWLVDGGGLARQDLAAVTSDDADNANIPSGPPDPNSRQLLAKEISSLQFEYWDGMEWNDSWDGTQLGADGVTPIGSPVAVAVTIGLAQPDSDEVKTYRHVIAIPTANNPTAAGSSTGANSLNANTANSASGSSGSSSP